jgi:tetracycline resistance efflux pump
MQVTWLSVLPPIVVALGAIALKDINYAITAGILTASFVAANGNVIVAGTTLLTKIVHTFNGDFLSLYCFLICIPALIQIFICTGSAHAFTRSITKKFSSPFHIELACCISSLLLSIDDYLSILVIGNVMRNTVDKMGIAREKLAYLIHTLSGTLVIMCPISSWVATICMYLQQSGISNTAHSALIFADPFFVYLDSIPYMLYSLLTIISVGTITTKRLSFGPMALYEKSTVPHQPTAQTAQKMSEGNTLELLVPLGVLLTTTIMGILYMGEWHLLGGNNTLIEAFKNNTHIFSILATASMITLSSTLLYLLYKKQIHLHTIPNIIYSSFCLMKPVLTMLLLLALLSSYLRNELATGAYIASILGTTTTAVYLPVVIFIMALILAIVTGSSWSTFGLLLPIVIPMINTLGQVQLLYPILGAVFSGAVCGDHISLFSETTTMSAGCTEISPLVHVKTQLPYAFPAIIGSLVGFVAMGFLHMYPARISYWLPLGLATCTCIILLAWLQKKSQKKF